jgi:hypothetical protein
LEAVVAWKVAGPDDRFFAYHGKAWTADSETYADALVDVGKPVPVTPTGPVYTPTGPDDAAGLYLLALQLVPGPLTITRRRSERA